MNLYVDDDTVKALLVILLRRAGHQVTVPADVGMAGQSDARHLVYAATNSCVVLTRNHDDFRDLHFVVQATHGHHPNMLVVRSDNDPTRDMKDRDIVRAIAKLEKAAVPIANELHILNQRR
jgi:predicted nuclease of predicted toxin-antitoxin system